MPRIFDKLPFMGKRSIYAGYKPYTVDVADDGLSAEVNLYGQIVETHPIDWWTGEKVDGLFIALDEFLDTLDYLGSVQSVRFNINSIGGSVDAGIAIYNKIRDLSAGGVEIVTRVEGAADSAASIIMQAGDRREVCIGSEVMIHCASCLLFNYYNSKDLDSIKNMLDAADERIAGLLADSTKKSAQEVKRMMQKTTWMTAQEAVENGFADEVVNQKVTVQNIAGVQNGRMVNGIPQIFRGIPVPWTDGTATADKKPEPENTGTKEPETEVANGDPPETINKSKEVKQMTLQELETQYPDLVNQVRDAATADAKAVLDKTVADAVKAERRRIKDIEDIENSIVDKAMVRDAKYGDEPIDAKALAFNAMQMQAKAGGDYLRQREEETQTSGAQEVTGNPNSGLETEDRAKEVKAGAEAISKYF